MTINLKKKIMLAVLAGGILCANGAFAANEFWYGTNTPTANQWTTDVSKTVTSGLTLTVADGQEVGGFALADVTKIFGGYSGDGSIVTTVTGNSITFNTNTARTKDRAEIYGGYSLSGDATGNSVIVNSGTFGNIVNVTGGFSAGANAKGNSVIINGGNFAAGSQIIRGGQSGDGNVGGSTPEESNIVTISGGTFGTDTNIYGGFSGGSATVTGNIVKISGVDFGDCTHIRGGWSTDGNTIDNIVEISGGTFGEATDVYGGWSTNGNTIGNIVEISGSTFGPDTEIYGGSSNSGSVIGNKLNIKGGSFGASNKIYGGYNYGTGSVSGNIVTIKGGSFTQVSRIYGGYNNGTGSVSGNIVTIKGGSFEGETAGNATIFWGGYSHGAVARDNIVNIEDGHFGEYCFFYGGDAQSGTANNNIMNVTGGEFKDNFAFFGGWANSFSGNVLNLKKKINSRAMSIQGFSTINFTLPTEIADGDTMLKTTTMTFDPTNKTTINVYAANGVKLNAGDVITLIDTTNTFVPGDYTKGTILDGAAELVNKEDQNKILQIVLLQDFEQKSSGDENQQKAPVEAISATAAMLNQSADLAMGEGLTSLLENTNGNNDENNQNAGATTENAGTSNINTFGALNANRSKYKTGSHVDMDGWGFLVGAGNTKNWNNGEKTTYGLFFEYGKGDFDTYNNDIHGEGDSNNKGVGVIARHTLNNNTYFDGAIRYGKQETEWNEIEIGSYDTDSKYFGTSLGIGHIYPIGKNELDIYGRYTYGHTGSCDATVGDKEYKFDSVKSSRLRVGTKLNIIVKGKKVKPYVGVAWEREMKGESKATITGMGEAPAPSLKGNTGIMQAGCSWEAGKWTLGAEANAYIGKRKGWGGMFNAFYNF